MQGARPRAKQPVSCEVGGGKPSLSLECPLRRHCGRETAHANSKAERAPELSRPPARPGPPALGIPMALIWRLCRCCTCRRSAPEGTRSCNGKRRGYNRKTKSGLSIGFRARSGQDRTFRREDIGAAENFAPVHRSRMPYTPAGRHLMRSKHADGYLELASACQPDICARHDGGRGQKSTVPCSRQDDADPAVCAHTWSALPSP